MHAGIDDFQAADKNRPNQPPASNKDIFVEPQVSASSGEIGVVGIEHDDVRALSRFDRSDSAPERLSTAGERVRLEAATDRFTFAPCQHVAGALAQALIVLELAQLRGRVELDI